MATVTGLTAERMLEIEAESIVDARVEDGELILIKHDGTEVNAGSVEGPAGPVGPTGPAGVSAIPGEVKLWPGTALPELATYGKWVWADGAIYPVATYPIAAAHIAAVWKTLGGYLSDPGAGNFRVPDLRGVIPAGIDAMPGGSRPTDGRPRIARADGAVQAKPIGKETHVVSTAEMPAHTHASTGGHLHAPPGTGTKFAVSVNVGEGVLGTLLSYTAGDEPLALFKSGGTAYANIATLANTGGGGAHENVQPTVMVPYIVYLG